MPFHYSLFQTLHIGIIGVTYNGAIHNLLNDDIHDVQGNDKPLFWLVTHPLIINDRYMKLNSLQYLMHQVFKLLRVQVHHLIGRYDLHWRHQIGRFMLGIGNTLFYGVRGEAYLIEILLAADSRIL